jgi:hypothetical protein
MVELKIAVVFFAFNRPDCLSKTILSYLECDSRQDDNIYVFIDGPRAGSSDKALVEECYRVAKELLPQAIIISRIKNMGLKRSVFSGISEVSADCDAMIVIEDDLSLDVKFYKYMVRSLKLYANDKMVYQISGFNYHVSGMGNNFFLPIITSWGWATWSSRWKGFDIETDYVSLIFTHKNKKRYDFNNSFSFSKMLRKESRGNISSWAIRWYSYVFSNEGLTLYPASSLVINEGFTGSGTHSSYKATALFGNKADVAGDVTVYPDQVLSSESEEAALQAYFKVNGKRKYWVYLKAIILRFVNFEK